MSATREDIIKCTHTKKCIPPAFYTTEKTLFLPFARQNSIIKPKTEFEFIHNMQKETHIYTKIFMDKIKLCIEAIRKI